MEPHRQLGPEVEEYRPDLAAGPVAYFEKALAFARRFYGAEMESIASVDSAAVTPDYFFREYVWVVHATGFSAKAVGKFMGRLVEAYGPWQELAGEEFEPAMERVRHVCNNPQKARAVWNTSRLLAGWLSKAEWKDVRDARLSSPEKLQDLPYVGKITCYHLGRNIGLLDCVKPDLHLVRMARHWGFSDCTEMCRVASAGSGLRLGIADLVLWYAASTFGTIDIRSADER